MPTELRYATVFSRLENIVASEKQVAWPSVPVVGLAVVGLAVVVLPDAHLHQHGTALQFPCPSGRTSAQPL